VTITENPVLGTSNVDARFRPMVTPISYTHPDSRHGREVLPEGSCATKVSELWHEKGPVVSENPNQPMTRILYFRRSRIPPLVLSDEETWGPTRPTPPAHLSLQADDERLGGIATRHLP
jgi:hypothetical protein